MGAIGCCCSRRERLQLLTACPLLRPPPTLQAGQGQDVEESGWKMVSGDVFRAPSAPLSLCVQVGSGVQILASGFITLLFAALVRLCLGCLMGWWGGSGAAGTNPSPVAACPPCRAASQVVALKTSNPCLHRPSPLLLPPRHRRTRASCPPPRAAPCSPRPWSCTCCCRWRPATARCGCGAWSTAPTRAGSRSAGAWPASSQASLCR